LIELRRARGLMVVKRASPPDVAMVSTWGISVQPLIFCVVDAAPPPAE